MDDVCHGVSTIRNEVYRERKRERERESGETSAIFESRRRNYDRAIDFLPFFPFLEKLLSKKILKKYLCLA